MLRFSALFTVRCTWAVLSGLAFAMAFPPVGWRWLVLPALVGLLMAIHCQHGTRARLLGFLFGYTAFAVGLSWIWNIFGQTSIVLWAVMALFPAAFAHFQGRAMLHGWSGWKLAGYTAINWGAWELIRAEVFPLKFPWMTVGLAVGPNGLLSWVGVYVTGCIVVFAAAAIAGRMWKHAGVAIAVLAAALIFSRPHTALSPEDESVVRVAGVQLENVTIDILIRETRGLAEGVEHVVWPEYAVPYDIRRNVRDWNLLLDLCRERDITLTFGTQVRPDGGDEWFNIALTMDAEGPLGEHTKVRTVHLFDDGTPGTTAGTVTTPHGEIGTPICFDGDFEGVIRRMTSAGAEFIVIPTMDAESWSARQHEQHAGLARIRAAENGRWVFVTASSGISQIVDPAGHLHEHLAAMKRGVIEGFVKRETVLTFYTQFGWVLPWGLLVLTAVLWILLAGPPRTRKQPKGSHKL